MTRAALLVISTCVRHHPNPWLIASVALIPIFGFLIAGYGADKGWWSLDD